MLVKYANLVKIQPIAPDKRVRLKASSLLIISIKIIDTFLYRKSEETHLAPLTHLAKHAILAKFSGLYLKRGSHLQTILHIIV